MNERVHYVIELYSRSGDWWQGTSERAIDGRVENPRGLSPTVAHALAVVLSRGLPLSLPSYTSIMLAVSADDLPSGAMLSATDDRDIHRIEIPLAPEVASALAILLRATLIRETS